MSSDPVDVGETGLSCVSAFIKAVLSKSRVMYLRLGGGLSCDQIYSASVLFFLLSLDGRGLR
jgi:hypothetical protein